MSEQMFYSIAERFISINGEGTHAGRLAAFIRFPGCNLHCAWCDTQWANAHEVETELVSTEELCAWVREAGVRCVTLTGGEPLLQLGLSPLVEQLMALPTCASVSAVDGAGLFVEVETNGSCDLAELQQLRLRKQTEGCPHTLAFALDCKLPGAGEIEAASFLGSNVDVLQPHDTVKFVCADASDMDAARTAIAKYRLSERCHVLLSPAFGRIEPADMVAYMKEHAMADVALQLQMHKVIWPAETRGV